MVVSKNVSRKPLEGLLFVALEQAVAAPYCSSRLADAGARVIKIGRAEGDFARGYDTAAGGMSSYFVWLNRGKECLVADIKTPGDAELLHALLAKADVFIQNLAPGAADRAGFGSKPLREKYPRLITVDISGYGPDNQPGYESNTIRVANRAHVDGHVGSVFATLSREVAEHRLRDGGHGLRLRQHGFGTRASSGVATHRGRDAERPGVNRRAADHARRRGAAARRGAGDRRAQRKDQTRIYQGQKSRRHLADVSIRLRCVAAMARPPWCLFRPSGRRRPAVQRP